jgi:UDPglucose--hexose-1-phosphate uridylyltransferase
VAGQALKPPAFDPTCYLCPGNARVGGATNPAYTSTFVFDNDHPCVGAEAPSGLTPPIGVYRNRPATGVARVVCYSPRHDLTLAELDVDGVEALLETWQLQMQELATHRDVNFVLIFENKGALVGVSNPHPHCQIYATNFTFKYIETELRAGRRHLDETGRTLFHDIVAAEREDGRRIVSQHGSAIAFVPYFARYAYETYVAPLRGVATIDGLNDEERRDLPAAGRAVRDRDSRRVRKLRRRVTRPGGSRTSARRRGAYGIVLGPVRVPRSSARSARSPNPGAVVLRDRDL